VRTKIFLPCLLVLVVITASFYGCRVQNPTLIVTVGLDLTVLRDSSSRPGLGRILELNTSVSVITWPQTAVENVYVNPIPKYSFGETRAVPVHFAVSIYLDGTNKTVLTPDNLTITGDYSAQVSSFFSGVNPGTYNLTIVVYVPKHEDYTDQLTRFITIP
jgi:hypothetical protein